ncbi:non-ribosomal peptide synthetase [Vibrio sp. S9_S30]|uniref:non-ribosomal peptide synthetase n=1 Tax=Vibrio sp. S9_S30 TaxID=2720226 RepID=UPI00168107B3|nr:non-ribosomal peptide synthetase [Vibrio sp. S9_S30]MBD1559381.1 non-ribosomal peptide synthetase [Vibrio sp. S9_S30]
MNIKNNIEQGICLPYLFEERCLLSGDKCAIDFKNKKISFNELNSRANKLARLLVNKRVKAGDVVAILLDRSEDVIVSILAVLKMGAAYLPVDLNYPASRVEHMLKDSLCAVVIADDNGTRMLETLPSAPSVDVALVTDSLVLSPLLEGHQGTATDLAYLIYTSGSTGKPKGVCVTHGNVVNFNAGMQQRLGLGELRSMASLTTVCFDIFVLESLVALLQGLTVRLISDDERKSMSLLSEALSGVDALQITPSHLSVMIDDPRIQWALSGLKTILVGGEAFPVTLLKKLQSVTQARIFNLYGPTETTVWSTVQDVTHKDQIDIGSPILNTQILILDDNNNALPQGEVGEIGISGKGVTAGYWNRSELTAQRFIEHPLALGKVYKTGDLGRANADGSYQCLGRIDHQVKINGHRVELGDIESHILAQPNVQQVGVVVSLSESCYGELVAFVVSTAFDAAALRQRLSLALPSYMVPAFIEHLATLPTTGNGKVDRQALAQLPPTAAIASQAAISPQSVLPETDIEEEIHRIWCEVLSRPHLCCTQRFMDLGGTSVLAIQLLSGIGAELGVDVTFSDFITRGNTIQSLAQLVEDRIIAEMSEEEIEALMASEE